MSRNKEELEEKRTCENCRNFHGSTFASKNCDNHSEWVPIHEEVINTEYICPLCGRMYTNDLIPEDGECRECGAELELNKKGK